MTFLNNSKKKDCDQQTAEKYGSLFKSPKCSGIQIQTL